MFSTSDVADFYDYVYYVRIVSVAIFLNHACIVLQVWLFSLAIMVPIAVFQELKGLPYRNAHKCDEEWPSPSGKRVRNQHTKHHTSEVGGECIKLCRPIYRLIYNVVFEVIVMRI